MATGYQDIENRICAQIKRGDLKPGDRVGPIRQIAADFGVSPVTADRALRELARKGVLNHVPRHGFFVSAPELQIRGKIHAIVRPIDRKTPFGETLSGIIGEAWPRGYSISVSLSQNNTEQSLEAAQRAVLEQVDGVVYMVAGEMGNFAMNREPVKLLIDQGLPVVTIGHCDLPGIESVPGVSSAHEQAGFEITRHLLSKGLKRLAVLGVFPNQDEQYILEGCRRACREADVPLRPNWVRFHLPGESVAQDVQYLLNSGKRPDAIFALSDLVAAETMDEIIQTGLKVPDDISVVGFGDYPIAELVRPALTTMRINLQAVGSLATNTLIRMIEGHPYDTSHTEIPCQLIVRDSCLH
jgi:DNA-binding LacI/PurR family transcriptional regulator